LSSNCLKSAAGNKSHCRIRLIVAYTQRRLPILAGIDTRTRFAKWGPDANPLIVHLKRQPSRLTLRRTLWLGFGLGLLSLGISAAAVLTAQRDQLGFFAGLVFLVGWLVTLLTPFLTASAAAVLTQRALRPERFDLIRMTPLPNETLVWAQVFTALYRMRLVYLVLVTLMPVLVVGVFFLFLSVSSVFYYYDPVAPSYWEVVGPTLFALALILELWGMNLLGAAVGVRMGLLRRSTSLSIIAAPLIILIVMACPCVCCTSALSTLPGEFTYLTEILLAMVLPLFLTALPYILTAQVIESTARAWRR
jgi:hypothetical protein